MSRKLQNYVRTYRKRAGLSQDEMALLLGCRSGAKVSRYERFAREPTLQTALAYEAVFGAPVSELFGGVYEQSRAAIQVRAGLLAEMLRQKNSDPQTGRKLELLSTISSSRSQRN